LHQAKKLSCVEAAELLGLSERHFRRLRAADEAHGAEGIVDRRRGRTSGRRVFVNLCSSFSASARLLEHPGAV